LPIPDVEKEATLPGEGGLLGCGVRKGVNEDLKEEGDAGRGKAGAPKRSQGDQDKPGEVLA
jgi:hypothetical protein